MPEYLTPEVVISLISAIASIVVALITYRKSEIPLRRRPIKGPGIKVLQAAAAGTAAVTTFFIIQLIVTALTPRPTIQISSPTHNSKIVVQIAETGSGAFSLTGTSSRVQANPDLRIYALVHPSDPFAEGWWIQSAAAVDLDGTWKTLAWVGSPDFPPADGNLVEIVAIAVASPSIGQMTWVEDFKDLSPLSQSRIVEFEIARDS